MKRLVMISLIVCVLGLSVLTGCDSSGFSLRQQSQSTNSLDLCSGPLINAECIITYFSEDGEIYISEQTHQICPGAPSIRISAQEPQGDFVWRLSGNSFSTLKNPGSTELLLCNKAIAQAILTAFAAGSGFMSDEGTRPDPVKVQGQWYQPIIPGGTDAALAGITLFQNRDNSLIELVTVKDTDSPRTLTAKCYNLRKFNVFEKSIPMKIDIFSDIDGSKSSRVLQISYQQIRPAK